uniref:Uncharacterized protein n=1 Tax=Arundo donax TaxID=35708 RepID=A0A0A9CGS2_ARUDO
MIFKTSSCHEFIYKQPLVILNTIPNQLNKVFVMQLSQKVNFCHPFSMSLKSVWLQTFNCYSNTCARFCSGCAVWLNPPLEDVTKPTLPKNTVWSKIHGGRFQLLKGKLK